MTGDDVRGLPQLVTYLSGFPDPLDVAGVLATGPLAHLGARTCIVMLADEESDELRLVSSYGFDEGPEARYRGMLLRVRLPIVAAYRENRTIVTSTADFVEDHAALALNKPRWAAAVDELGPGSVIDAPIVSDGAPIGSIAVTCTGDPTRTAEDFALIDGITAALGLWITHPDSGVAGSLTSSDTGPDSRIELTDRQVRILDLVRAGKSNVRISLDLGVSESTVKQEVRRVLRILRTNDRRTAADRAQQLGLLS